MSIEHASRFIFFIAMHGTHMANAIPQIVFNNTLHNHVFLDHKSV